ncbi:polysaccharide deacetylase family protein [Echinicola sp. CAU 1574]|uniref:Polysaccharide deacetylase family protein n=1 Tax=Echinicola arenosa TaxID=2774144 RepID=A0ABR9API7_9BACT|nr:polysaccharide deacetylase family protein [Echinicola arenosa]MBD8490479.1 polysaccharide deacetylase family protein [Echinicola arenosa]
MKKSIRNFFAYFVAKSLILSGKVNKAKKAALNGDHILSIYFHNPSKDEFEFVINWLKRNGFNFLSLDDYYKILNEEIKFPKGSVMITVDDGWASNVENMAAVADQHKVPISIFLATEAVEQGSFWFSIVKKASKSNLNYPSSEELKLLPNEKRLEIVNKIRKKILSKREAMTIDEVKRIIKSDYVTVGAHSHSHPILIRCTDKELEEEIKISKQKVELWTDSEIKCFAYPNGDFGSREIDMLKRHNFELGFATTPIPITRNLLKEKYAIPRIGFLEGGSKAENICRITGVWHSNTKTVFKKN